MKIKLVLQRLDGTNVEFERTAEEVSKYAILTYGGAYFVYRGYTDRFYTEIAFCEVEPPHSLD